MSKKNFFRFGNATDIPKNWMDLSHTNSGSCNMGQLIPVLVEPTLPDDFFDCKVSYLARLAQMVAPPMTRIGIHFFPFYCPNRILMDPRKWDKFLSDIDGNKSVTLPTLSFSPIYAHIKESIDLYDVVNWVNGFLGGFEYPMYFNFEDNYPSLTITSLVFKDSGYELYDQLGDVFGSDEILSLNSYLGTDFLPDEQISDIFKYLTTKYKSYPFVGTLLDYMGFPVNSPLMSTSPFIYFNGSVLSKIDQISPQIAFQVLPLIAYLFIWNEYFRQEYIQDEVSEELLTDFNNWKNALDTDLSILWKVKRRDWEHDYYTSCLPAPQLGESSSISIGEDGAFTIPELREANVLQRVREKLLHGGSRVWEILANFFSSEVADARIQIPHYITPEPYAKGHAWLRISDIYQTAPGSSDSFPSLSADSQIAAPRGASANASDTCLHFKFKAAEHGYIIILMNIQPETVYCQGIPRHFMSLDTLDYGWPDFANLTEQPVYSYELYATPQNVLPTGTGDYKIFGYMPQYSWYKFHQSELHGELRDDLDFFHFGRIFEDEPSLNSQFLECNPSDRPFPIEYEYDKITYHLAFDFGVDRRLPYYGVPSLR